MMKNYSKSAFNAAASILGGTGISFFSFFTIWCMTEGNSAENNVRIATNLALLTGSAVLFGMGHTRSFFSGKTTQLLKRLGQPSNHGPQ
jgi:hypothetical protein